MRLAERLKASRPGVYTTSPSSPRLQAEGEQKCTSSASHIPESWRRASMGSASRSRQGGTGAPGSPNMERPTPAWSAHVTLPRWQEPGSPAAGRPEPVPVS